MKNAGIRTSMPVFLAFLCMGFGDAVGPMVSLVEESFNISNFQAQLISLSGFIMFGLLSIPMGILQDRKGKKYIMNLGLIIALIGLLIPVFNGMYGPIVTLEDATTGKFVILLFAILLLGAGATTLQVVGNPIMRDVSPVGNYSSNLSFAQSIKAVGSSLGFLLPPFAIKFLSLDWSILFPVYSLLILINILWFNSSGFKESTIKGDKPATIKSCFSLLKNSYVLVMVMGIFFYVGAEVSMSSEIPVLLKRNFGIEEFGLWLAWALFFLPILLGRFTGGIILRYLSPRKFLLITVSISVIGLALIFLNNQMVTFVSIILVGLGFANIFPLIFSITVDKMPERSNELSGLMVTAIVGGAILPPIMGKVADLSSITIAFVIPLIAILYNLFVAIKSQKV
ncbi:MAG: MFS transporter [Bacteroidales bacterium]|nr:MFS transporter [Bacteroidales bacterium]MCF8402775.1 MFS transporter [Bacteroidales bacterium]